MRIMIEQILSSDKISFSSEFGKGIASWETTRPQCKEYAVEVDIEDDLIWGQSIKKSSQEVSLISVNEGINTFIGVLESIDDDGYSVLRMGNAIIPFYANGTAFEVGSMIEINVKNAVMTPYD